MCLSMQGTTSPTALMHIVSSKYQSAFNTCSNNQALKSTISHKQGNPFGTVVGGKRSLLVDERFAPSFLIHEFALRLNGHRFLPGLVDHRFVLPYT